jgi:hypothetical protein
MRRTFATPIALSIGVAAFAWLARLASNAANTTNRPRARFVDVAQSSGLNARNVNGGDKTKSYIVESTGSGIAFFDYNNDGYQDIFMVNGSAVQSFAVEDQPTNHLFRNNRNGTFTDVTKEAGLVHSGWGQGVCAGDYDNDGWLDLFVTYYGKNVLYHNNGDGTFSDVTDKAGLATTSAVNYSTGCGFVDYNRDGLLDLFVANYTDLDLNQTPLRGSSSACRWKGVAVFCGPKGLPLSRNHLYRNNGHGTFTDVSQAAGIWAGNRGYAFSVLTADLRNCGWPDIYVACDSTPSLLYRNNRDGTFTEIGLPAGVAYSDAGIAQAGMGLAAGDYDGDGFLDIFKTNFMDDTSNLYRNNSDATFTDVIFRVGGGHNTKFLGWGTGFFDYDNDGWADVFVANGGVYPEVESQYPDEPYRQRKILYHNRRDGTFEDVSLDSGTGILLARSSRGVAFADINNDGSVCIVINNQNDFPTLLRNELPTPHHWIEIKTIGTRSNRAGIGARVKVVSGSHSQIDEVRSGGSYISQNDLRLHFGLGDKTSVDLLELRWPSGITDQIRNLPADSIVTVKEGAGVVERQPISAHLSRE